MCLRAVARFSFLHRPFEKDGVCGINKEAAKPPLSVQTGWSDRRNLKPAAELTTPALRATPPLPGGEYCL